MQFIDCNSDTLAGAGHQYLQRRLEFAAEDIYVVIGLRKYILRTGKGKVHCVRQGVRITHPDAVSATPGNKFVTGIFRIQKSYGQSCVEQLFAERKFVAFQLGAVAAARGMSHNRIYPLVAAPGKDAATNKCNNKKSILHQALPAKRLSSI